MPLASVQSRQPIEPVAVRVPKWYLAYVLLALINVLSLAASLYVGRALTDTFHQSIQVNSKWATLQGELGGLRGLAGAVNAPGNDVFDSGDAQKESARADAAVKAFQDSYAALSDKVTRQAQGEDQKRLSDGMQAIEFALAEMMGEAAQIFNFFAASEPHKAGKHMALMDRKYAQLNEAFAALEANIRAIQARSFAEQERQAASLRRWQNIAAAAMLLVVAAALFYGYRSYLQMRAAARDKESASAAMANLNQTLAHVVQQVTRGSEAIANAARQLLAGNNHLSDRTQAQAATVEQAVASTEEMSATVKNNADHAAEAKSLAEATSQLAGKGSEVVSSVVETMNLIQSGSTKMGDIISVIDGIAFQTNILALNAAVESARAGEHGRGFGVVASEVRSLAQRSATAAKEIKSLIEESIEKVGAGGSLVRNAGATMNEIVDKTRKVTELMVDVSGASREQSDGIDQLSHAMMQIDDTTQKNASMVQEVAGLATALEQQVRDIVELLRMAENGADVPDSAEVSGRSSTTRMPLLQSR